MLLSIVRARARAGVGARPSAGALLHRRRGGRGTPRVPDRWSRPSASGSRTAPYAVGEVGGFSTTVRGRRLYLIEAAEKGMAWMRLTAHGQRGPRLDAAPRQRRHHARRGGGADRPARVARAS